MTGQLESLVDAARTGSRLGTLYGALAFRHDTTTGGTGTRAGS